MSETLTPDICIIGAGSAGLSVAAAAAAFGVDVVLVEKGRMGGDCLNFGCVPSKALIAAGKHAERMRHGARFGIADAEPEIDFRKVNRHVREVIEAIAPNDSVERFTALGVRVIQAPARFTDARTVAAGEFTIRARRFVVAAGSSPLVPDIPGLDGVPFLTNETIFDLTRRPARLIVIGGGPIGLELAQAHGRLGSRVTVLEGARALGREDPEIAAPVLARLRAEGIAITEGARVTRVEPHGKTGVRVHFEDGSGQQSVDGSHLLVAVGRRANLGELGLEAAGIRHDGKRIAVSGALRTSNRRVYAIGDIAGGPQFTHVANYHAGLVVRSILFRLPVRARHGAIARTTFTDPEVAHVGMTEAEARERHGRISILRWPLAENDRAQAERETEGLAKLVVGKRGRILGVSIAAPGAGEMIGLWSLAMSRGMTVTDMAQHVPPYPTMGEIGKRAAMTYFTGATRKPIVRRIVRFLRRFG
jgi:pyruvate/2-oxoglutarate dehydrogenase complex dihydrolipoamide dehydrogenase (E3) component